MTPHPTGPGRRILYVDDQTENFEFLKHILTNYELVYAPSLAEGMLLARAERFDLYLLDLRLGDGSALDLCELIRSLDETVPIIICSADIRDSVKQQALQSGAQVFLNFPLDFDLLETEITRLLQT